MSVIETGILFCKKKNEKKKLKALNKHPNSDDVDVCSLIYGNQKMTNSKYLADIKLIYVKKERRNLFVIASCEYF